MSRHWSRWLVSASATAVVAFAPLGLLGVANGAVSLLRSGTIVVTNLNTNSLSVVSPTTHRVTKITGHGLNGPLGIAISPNGRTAYVTNSLGRTVVPVNLASRTVGAPVKVGGAPSAIAISPDGATAYVTNFNDNTVTPISLTGPRPVPEKPIRVGAGPWSVAVSPDGSVVLVSDSEGNAVSVIDVATRHVSSVKLSGRPQAIAIAPDGRHAYVVDGQNLTSLALGQGVAHLGRSVPVAAGPVGIAMSSDGQRAYTVNTNNTLSIFSPTTLAISGTTGAIAQLTQPDGVALSPDGRIAYVAGAGGQVAPIDVASRPMRALAQISVGSPAFGIAVVPDQAPVAKLLVTVAIAGHVSTFSAAGSYAPNGKIARYEWNFGDGTTLVSSTPVVHHTYAKAGDYQVSVVVVTAYGTSTATTFTGQMVSNRGSPRAGTTASVTVPASLQLSPASGAPGIGVKLVDTTVPSSCSPAYVFFDGKLIDQTNVHNGVLSIAHMVIPGDAKVGRHTIEVSCSTKLVPVTTADFQVVPTPNHLMEFSVAMPTLGEMKGSLVGASGISVILVLLGRLISAGFPSDWMDHTYEENRDRIFPKLRRRLKRFAYDSSRERSMLRRLLGGTSLFLTFVLIGGLVNSFLDPAFGWNRESLWLFIGQSFGILFITLASQVTMAISGWRRHRKVHLQVLAGGLFIAVFSVILSRIIGLAPGVVYGLIATFVIVPGTTLREEGRLHAISETVVLVCSTAAFLLSTVVFHAATQPDPSPWLLIITPALETMFLVGFSSLAFGLFPLPFLPGRHVAKWNHTAWYALSGLGLIGFVAVLLGPGSGSQQELAHVGLVPLFVGFGVFSAVSAGVMIYFRIKRGEEREEEEEEEESAEHIAEESESESDAQTEEGTSSPEGQSEEGTTSLEDS